MKRKPDPENDKRLIREILDGFLDLFNEETDETDPGRLHRNILIGIMKRIARGEVDLEEDDD